MWRLTCTDEAIPAYGLSGCSTFEQERVFRFGPAIVSSTLEQEERLGLDLPLLVDTLWLVSSYSPRRDLHISQRRGEEIGWDGGT